MARKSSPEQWQGAKEIRRANALALLQQHGSRIFTERIGWSRQQLSQYLGRNPIRGIGEPTARRIEAEFGLARNWLDTLHEADVTMKTPEGKITAVEVKTYARGAGLPAHRFELLVKRADELEVHVAAAKREVDRLFDQVGELCDHIRRLGKDL